MPFGVVLRLQERLPDGLLLSLLAPTSVLDRFPDFASGVLNPTSACDRLPDFVSGVLLPCLALLRVWLFLHFCTCALALRAQGTAELHVTTTSHASH